jgi:hypothetical protein
LDGELSGAGSDFGVPGGAGRAVSGVSVSVAEWVFLSNHDYDGVFPERLSGGVVVQRGGGGVSDGIGVGADYQSVLSEFRPPD